MLSQNEGKLKELKLIFNFFLIISLSTYLTNNPSMIEQILLSKNQDNSHHTSFYWPLIVSRASACFVFLTSSKTWVEISLSPFFFFFFSYDPKYCEQDQDSG